MILMHLQNKEFEYFYPHEKHHSECVEKFGGKDLYTVLFKSEFPSNKTIENPDKVRKIAVTHISKIEYEINSKSFYNGHSDEAEKTVKAHYPNLFSDNPKEYWNEFDYYCRCAFNSQITKAERELLSEWLFYKWCDENQGTDEEDFTTEKRKETRKKHKHEYLEYKKSIYLPTYTYKYERRFEIHPKPVSFCGERSYITQYFMIDCGDTVLWTNGSGSGSGTRFSHGIMGHTFAVLEQAGSKIHSVICHTNENFDLIVDREDDKLLLYGHDLTGNYQLDRNESEKTLAKTELVYHL